ncbi:DUF2750 domain-containing protein [Alteromonadaceae bacterium BrNp21-10]|nr:DUF2750 domain-containing protein [Alteromonadaceae bacterium BrNp21-10]
MSQSVYEAQSFCKEAISNGKVWGIKDATGIPVPEGDGGIKTMPFWSSEANAQAFVSQAKNYVGFEIFEVALTIFVDKWLTGLATDEVLVGLNWSGEHALGADIEPENLKEAIEYQQSEENSLEDDV